MRGTANSEQGLTLLEVMIALAIVAIALTVLLGLANRSLRVNERLERLTRATLLAQEKMAEIENTATRRGSLAADEGVCDPPFDDYRWRSSYGETPLPSVRRVDVTVRWGEEKHNEAVTLTSFVRGG